MTANQGQRCAPPAVLISDCTLREGEQQPGVVLGTAEKVAIAEILGDAGIGRAEIGTPAVSEGEREAIAAVVDARRIAEPIGVCRARTDDVELAHQCGLWGVVISSPVSHYQLENKFGWSVAEMVDAAVQAHTAAKELGLRTFASAYDTLRSSRDDIRELYGELRRQRLIDGIRVVDTVGIGTPAEVSDLVRWCDNEFGLPIEVHFHDDFGLAMANALAAVQAGAGSVSCSIAGVGERAGNVPTEEIVAALEFLLHVSTGVELELLGPAFIKAADIIGIRLQDNRAIIGRNSFRHISGISVSGLIRSPLAAQPIEAEAVGRRSEVVLGKLSGRTAVEYVLSSVGIDPATLDVGGLVEQVKDTAESTRRILSESDLLRLVRAQKGRGTLADSARPLEVNR
jgi:isopropylmalate/homocitrate/citramalate synthase